MVTRRTHKPSTKRTGTTNMYTVEGKIEMKSKPLTGTKADAIAKKIRSMGGTAVKRKV